MATKYELQAELRELNRGMKALPISRMKKHELEHTIDSMRKLKIEKAATPMPAPAKAGRPMSRPVASESIEDDGFVMHVPVAPRVRQVEKRSVKKVADKLKVDGSDLFPAVTKAVGKARGAPAPVRVEPDSDEEMAKKVKKHAHAHACNCNSCPHGGALVHFA
jgi:hypothetical protein